MNKTFFELPAPYIILSATIALLTYLGHALASIQRGMKVIMWPITVSFLLISSYATVGSCLTFLWLTGYTKTTPCCLIPVIHSTFCFSILCVAILITLRLMRGFDESSSV